MQETQIDVDALAEGEDFNITITRPEFEDLCKEDFNKCIPIVEKALKDASLTKEQINDVVLVGGSTRIPRIQQIVKDYFGKEPNKTLHPDEAVAIGAAIQGAIANNVEDEGLERLVLLDVTPLSLGLELNNGEMDVLIPRNTTIPCEKVEKYQNARDNQTKLGVKVYQGERKVAKENKFLGKLQINIPPKPRGKVRIEVTFALDINGVLKVSAKDTAAGETTNLDIKMDNVMDESIIEELIKKAEEMEEDDKKYLEKVKLKTELQRIALNIKNSGSENAKKKANEILKWIRINVEATKEEIEEKLNEINNLK